MSAVFEGPVNQVAGNDIHNYHAEPPGPDDDSEHVRDCPQCKRRTWAMTQHCHYCKLDLVKFDERQRWLQVRRRLAAVLALLGFLTLLPPDFFMW